jgi:hypothetical protein
VIYMLYAWDNHSTNMRVATHTDDFIVDDWRSYMSRNPSGMFLSVIVDEHALFTDLDDDILRRHRVCLLRTELWICYPLKITATPVAEVGRLV